MAILAGKCLAFFISHTDLFGDCLISLISFSSGSIVAYHCAYDLFRLGRLSKLNSVCFVGSPLTTSTFDTNLISNLRGRIFNVYSHKDFLMKYVTDPRSDNEEEPIGLREFTIKDFVEFEKPTYGIGRDLKMIRNLNLSEVVKCHSEYKFHATEILNFLDKSMTFDLLFSRIKLITTNPSNI